GQCPCSPFTIACAARFAEAPSVLSWCGACGPWKPPRYLLFWDTTVNRGLHYGLQMLAEARGGGSPNENISWSNCSADDDRRACTAEHWEGMRCRPTRGCSNCSTD